MKKIIFMTALLVVPLIASSPASACGETVCSTCTEKIKILEEKVRQLEGIVKTLEHIARIA